MRAIKTGSPPRRLTSIFAFFALLSLALAPRRRLAAAALSAGVLALSASVIYGWHTGSDALIRSGLAGTPLQYNTAVGALIAALALLFASRHAYRPVAVLATCLSVGGALTVIQYMTGLDLGIDRALLEPWHVARRAYPGRMAPQTALCLTSLGVGLLCIRRAPLIGSTAAIAVLVIGFLTLAGYIMEVRPAFAWGSATPMALTTAVALIALSGSLALLVSPALAVDRPGGPWIAYVAGAATLLGAVSFAGAITEQRDRLVDRVIVETMAGFGREVRSQVRHHATGLHNLETKLPTLDDGFRACRPASRLLMRTPGGPAALEWIDQDLNIRRRVLSKTSRSATGTHDLHPEERAAFVARGSRSGPFTTPPRMLDSGYPYFRIVLPLGYPGHRVGFVAAVVFLDDFLKPVLGSERPIYDMSITAGSTTVFDSEPGGEMTELRSTADLELPGGVTWQVSMAPSPAFEVIFGTGMAEFAVTAGLVLAVLATSTIRGWQRVDLQRRSLVEANQTLHEEVEHHRREATARISAEDKLRLVHSTTPVSIRRRHLEEDLLRFASFVSHELRQPLASMRIFVELLESRIGFDTPEVREYVNELRENTERMVSAIEGQLALVHSVTSAEDASFEAVIDLDAVVSGVVDSLREPLDAVDATITFAPLARIVGNEPQVEQVFRNLFENAVKYRHPERQLAVIVDGNILEDQMYEVRIADNGSGFAPQAANSLFKMFQRLDPEHGAGSGLGLALCRRIVERHGGAIRAEGKPGEGATFYLTLPASSGSPANTPVRG